ncbi:SGNH/GDSL hydrolase family protein [Paenilisteria newyorkensis]|uniref:SGNH/GDSL hydrolase family protein n=1 Tax=Listeria newyorkensis TaxID=1497681 RepID=UPI000669D08C|nr:SGNH/GDSL hydrolase family protein [Listeria newyorkensis]KMT62085.1 hypothetical protein X559_1577 [Listeria newyorkensis]
MQHKKTWGKVLLALILLLAALTTSTNNVHAAETTDWSHVTWNVIGDSLTAKDNTYATKRYFDFIQENLHIKKINNYGISASTVGSVSSPISVRYASMENDADLITVFAGLNDYGKNEDLGMPSDSTNRTYYGALDVLMKGLTKKYPNKKIAYISMYARNFIPPVNKLGIPDYAYVNAEIEICERYHIPHLNLYEMDSINISLSGAQGFRALDGVHLNNAGHQHLAKIMEKFIKELP